ncbi:hypothetical protein [Xylanimonas ulmi]|uniref:Tfp pilus assembly protein PilN n=1 Tax=Xylanimonas ulmi TaxID=228973 RepID=A0A4Q7M3S4_9MICO|nr:hypothetical protein [Xylanibacterium ulmi]RZS61527.1 Tfp pilus assembly protein PilN [Xylanibacterium ulmi]
MSRRATAEAAAPSSAHAATPEVSEPFGGLQGVNLLPASVRTAMALRKLRIRLALVLAVVVLLVVGASVELRVLEAQARSRVDLATSETARLNAELASYAQALDVRAAIDRATDARTLAMGAEIRWVDLITQIEAVCPPGTQVVAFAAQALAPAGGSTVGARDPLATPGVASITFTITTPTLPETAAWLDALNSIPGLMDATFTNATLSDASTAQESALYTVASSVQVNVKALSNAHAEADDAGGSTQVEETEADSDTEGAGS